MSSFGEIYSVEEDTAGYTTAKGRFTTGSETYILEVYEGDATDGIGAKLFGVDENITGVLCGQPVVRGGCLYISSREPTLPETGTEVEAFARYLLQLTDEELQYTGPKELTTE